MRTRGNTLILPQTALTLCGLAVHYTLPVDIDWLCLLLERDTNLATVLYEAVRPLRHAFPSCQHLALWACGPPDPLVRAMVMMPAGTEHEALDGLWAFDAEWWLDHYQDTTVTVAFDYEMLSKGP